MTDIKDIARIEARMRSGEPFTYRQLCFLLDPPDDRERLVDRTIQKWRRNGWIEYRRVKSEYIWSLTEAGKQTIGG